MGVFDRDPPPQRQGSGLGGRLIMALLIAAVGLIMYWSQAQVNPVTGEKQHVNLTTDQEVRLGLQSAPEMARQMGGEVPASDPRTQEVKKIGDYIVSQSEAKKSPWKFDFHLLSDTSTINAFALPGGQIFITLGLFNKLQTEAQLAGVLSHEMGHVIERHTAQQMAKSQLGQILVVAVGTGASSDASQSNTPMVLASAVNNMIQLRYGREDESEADLWGIKLMEKAGYDPRAMIEVMQILKEATGDRGGTPEMFQTHPNPDLRIKQIKAYLEKNPPPPNLKEGRSLQELFDKPRSSYFFQ